MKQFVNFSIAFIAVVSIAYSGDTDRVVADDILGTWVFPAHGFHVEVSEVDDRYYGTIVYVRDSADEKGILKLDKRNPDEELRDRPYKGIQVLNGIAYVGNGKYKKGTIYEPEAGSYYQCIITLINKKEAKMRDF